MRNSKVITRIVFAGIILILFGSILLNYVHHQMSKGAAKRYVPTVSKNANGQLVTKSNNPAKAFTLTGPTNGKTVKQIGIHSGFYDAHIIGGDSQYWDSATSLKDEVGHLVTESDSINLEAGKKVVLTPSKFKPLVKQNGSYVITNPGNYLPDTQIPTGKYKVTFSGNLAPMSATPTSKSGSLLMIQLMTYDQQTIPLASEKDHYNVTMYQSEDGSSTETGSGVISIEKNRLLHVTMVFITDPNTKIILTPIK
ncbi:hypothetical protein [Fructobacillus ficulneus]|uniref:Uncharacterized protein n=1 Tax=Fructobacillus ficulneus TaxID=157463 RepID=A0A0K8MFW7_9LACO|nr:hypothetical protein [Fructobacillus ficulneus]GAO99400.1 hypothetical protein FFIC_100010 [Fructobacillus ficulneus]